MVTNQEDSIKKVFFTRIVLAGNLYDLSSKKLGKLFFNSESGVKNHFRSSSRDKEIASYVLERIRFSTINWNPQFFKEITGRSVTEYELSVMKDNILKELDRWVIEKNMVDESFVLHKDGRPVSYSYEALSNGIFAATLRRAKTEGDTHALNELTPSAHRELESTFHLKYSGALHSNPLAVFYSGRIE